MPRRYCVFGTRFAPVPWFPFAPGPMLAGMDCGTSYRVSRFRDARLGGGAAMSVTIHDVAPATQEKCEQLVARVERSGAIPMTLLIVPRYHHQASTPAFERWIETRLRRGDELALHGLTHLDPKPVTGSWMDLARRRWYTAGEGEFAALGHSEAQARLDAGRRWFERRGWPLRGFVAPAWLLGDGAWAAVLAQPLDYTCTLTRLITLPATDGMPKAVRGRSIVFSTRAAWRRHLSLAWNSGVAWRQQQSKWMRFELHPFDVDHDSVCSAIERWLERARAAQREPLTLGGLADRFC